MAKPQNTDTTFWVEGNKYQETINNGFKFAGHTSTEKSSDGIITMYFEFYYKNIDINFPKNEQEIEK